MMRVNKYALVVAMVACVLVGLASARATQDNVLPQFAPDYTIELPAADAARLGLTPPNANIPARQVGEAVGFGLYWCLMNVEPDADLPLVNVRCLTINDSYGLHPKIENGRSINGGTPIGADIARHRLKLERDLKRVGTMARVLPEGTLVAMDYESWPPMLPAEDDVHHAPYRQLALQQIRQRYPDLAEACVVEVAEREWKQKAAEFFEASIDVAKATRPELRWGFYYPQARHYWSGAYSEAAGDERRAANDVLTATWAKVDWFPASLYWFYPTGAGTTKQGHATRENNVRYVRDNVGEFVRLAGGAEDPRPVIAMIEPHIHHSNQAFKGEPIPADDLELIMTNTHHAGGDGLMVWGWVSRGDEEYVTKSRQKQAAGRRIAGVYVNALESIARSQPTTPDEAE